MRRIPGCLRVLRQKYRSGSRCPLLGPISPTVRTTPGSPPPPRAGPSHCKVPVLQVFDFLLDCTCSYWVELSIHFYWTDVEAWLNFTAGDLLTISFWLVFNSVFDRALVQKDEKPLPLPDQPWPDHRRCLSSCQSECIVFFTYYQLDTS